MFAALATAVVASFAPSNDQFPAVTFLGGGSAGTNGVPRLVIEGAPIVGGPFGLRLERGRPGAFGVAALSATDAPLPLPEFGATAYPSAPYFELVPFGLDGDGRSATLIGATPLAPALCGVTFAVQGFVVDDAALGGLAFTSGRRVRLGVDPKRRLFAHEFLPSPNRRALLGTADFDGDGRRDVSFVEFVSNSFGVYLARDDGWLSNESLTPLGASPGRYTTADFDNDGLLDVAVLLPGGQAAVALGRGDGTFETPNVFRVGAVVLDIGAGDFDGDGAIDLVTANGVLESITLVSGNGDGTFGLPFLHPVGDVVSRVYIADVSGDGALDVVIREQSSSTITLMHGDGNGAFDTPILLNATSSQGELFTVDLDLDGRLDLLTSNGTNTMNVWKGQAAGGLGPRVDFFVSAAFAIFALYDVDTDGKIDLVGSGTGGLRVLRGTGDTGFVPQQPTALTLGGQSWAVGDFNDDGNVDIVFAPTSGDATDENYVVYGLPLARFESTFEVATLESANLVESADLDGDDRDDLIVITASPSPAVHVQRNLGGGVFAAPVAIAGAVGTSAIEVVDFDRDGALDVVTSDSSGDVIRFMFGDGAGGFAAPVVVPADEAPAAFEVGDLDGDGWNDVVAFDAQDDELLIFLALGPRTLGAPTTLPLGASTIALELADVDGDGALDVLTLTDQVPALVRRLGNGDGTFRTAVPYPVVATPKRIIAADVDGDGDVDIVVQHSLGCGVQRNDGDGDFFAQPLIDRTRSETRPLLVDIDNDGDVDVVGAAEVLGTSDWGAVWVAINNGNGTFAAGRRHVASLDPWAVTVGDFDGDTLPDIVALDRNTDKLRVLLDRRAP